MKKPIILNTEMVKAVLSGNKTSTRRPLNKKLRFNDNPNDYFVHMCEFLEDWNPDIKEAGYYAQFADGDKEDPSFYEPIKAPYNVNDILYVRETHAMGMSTKDTMAWKASSKWDDFEDGSPEDFDNIKWTPSIHMPKWAARIFLKVTNIRVERVQDVTNEGIINEGVGSLSLFDNSKYSHKWLCTRREFETLWNSLYNNWDSNPWIWVIDFEVVDNVK